MGVCVSVCVCVCVCMRFVLCVLRTSAVPGFSAAFGTLSSRPLWGPPGALFVGEVAASVGPAPWCPLFLLGP